MCLFPNRYEPLASVLLGETKGQAAEERCRLVLQRCKLQGWQVSGLRTMKIDGWGFKGMTHGGSHQPSWQKQTPLICLARPSTLCAHWKRAILCDLWVLAPWRQHKRLATFTATQRTTELGQLSQFMPAHSHFVKHLRCTHIDHLSSSVTKNLR